MRRIICDRSLLDLLKGIHQEVIRSNFAELESNKYDGYIPVFTDGFCIDGRTGCAILLPNEVAKYRLLDDASIFTAELHSSSTLRIQESTFLDFVIYSDSYQRIQPSIQPKSSSCDHQNENRTHATRS
jgi:hypothetical protein